MREPVILNGRRPGGAMRRAVESTVGVGSHEFAVTSPDDGADPVVVNVRSRGSIYDRTCVLCGDSRELRALAALLTVAADEMDAAVKRVAGVVPVADAVVDWPDVMGLAGGDNDLYGFDGSGVAS